MFGEITISKLVSETAKRLYEAKECAEEAHLIADKINKSRQVSIKDIEIMLLRTADVAVILQKWEEYYNKFNSIINNKVDKLNEDNIRLTQDNKRLTQNNNKLIENNAKLIDRVDNIVSSLDNVLREIEDNAKLIAGSKGNRRKQANAVGNKSNRFIQELDTEELIKIYKGNNYSIPKDVKEYYNRQYGITYNGLRERLIKAGVWRGRQ